MKENDKVYNDKKDVDFLLEVIENAINLVEEPYYNLRTTYEPNGIVRERVFCYELYHRMRCILEERKATRLTLNGEVDKRGHINFKRKDRKNPDFVFHMPGSMEGNTIVVEVKGKATSSYLDACLKDFNTIVTFVSKYRYRVGVFILYNYSKCPFELVERLQEEYGSKLRNEISRNIYVICRKYGMAINITSLYEILCK